MSRWWRRWKCEVWCEVWCECSGGFGCSMHMRRKAGGDDARSRLHLANSHRWRLRLVKKRERRRSSSLVQKRVLTMRLLHASLNFTNFRQYMHEMGGWLRVDTHTFPRKAD